MNKVIDRRCKSIENMRKELLERHFKNEDVLEEYFDYVDLNMFSKSLNMKKKLYNAFFKSKYDDKIILHYQQVEC